MHFCTMQYINKIFFYFLQSVKITVCQFVKIDLFWLYTSEAKGILPILYVLHFQVCCSTKACHQVDVFNHTLFIFTH